MRRGSRGKRFAKLEALFCNRRPLHRIAVSLESVTLMESLAIELVQSLAAGVKSTIGNDNASNAVPHLMLRMSTCLV